MMVKTALCFLLLSLPLFSMTRYQYNDLLLGTPMTRVASCYGEPYDVRDCGDGTYEYEYIERFDMGNELVYENHYILTVVNGQIVAKRLRQETRPPYDQMYRQDPYFPSYP